MELIPLGGLVNRQEDFSKVSVFDRDNADSVINNCSKDFERILEAREPELTEYLRLDESAAKTKLNCGGHMTPTLNRLRVAFWNEYFIARDSRASKKRNLVLSRVYSGVCTSVEFASTINNNLKLAWILRPPVDTVLAMQETLSYGLDRIREILSIPLFKKESIRTGEDSWEVQEVLDSNAANVILKAVAMVDLRLHGAYKQYQRIDHKVDQHSVIESTKAKNVIDITNVKDIDVELAKLEQEVNDDVKKLSYPLNKDEFIVVEQHTGKPPVDCHSHERGIMKEYTKEETDKDVTDLL